MTSFHKNKKCKRGEKAGKRSRTGNRKFRGIWNKRLGPATTKLVAEGSELARQSAVGKRSLSGSNFIQCSQPDPASFRIRILDWRRPLEVLCSPPPRPHFAENSAQEGRKRVQGHIASSWRGQERIQLANPTASLYSLVSHSPWAFQPESIFGNNKCEGALQTGTQA